MQVTKTNLQTLYTGFQARFQGALQEAPSKYKRVAMEVASTTRQEDYGWMNKIPNVRKWVGDRVVNNLTASGFTIRNEPWELTVGVDRDDIEDDNLGIYGPLFEEMGSATGAHYDSMCFSGLSAGFTAKCFDGQFFFDTDHPMIAADGSETTYANTDGGAGAAWYLIDDSRALKPIILQKRKDWNFVAKTAPTDDNVFHAKEFLYGVDARHAVGYGLPQMAWGSKQPLNKLNYRAAREAMMSLKGDHGRPLGIMPRVLVVPPALEGEALELLNAERDAAGATNVYRGTAKLEVVPQLA